MTRNDPPKNDPRGPFKGPELALGSILGFRKFRVSFTGQLLPISNRQYLWTPGENIATCGTFPPMIPLPVASQHCTCGFYAYHDPRYALDVDDYPGDYGSVHGIIEAYGRVTIGSQGFRAEKARIKMLCADRPLFFRYQGVPRVKFTDLLDVLEAQGRPY